MRSRDDILMFKRELRNDCLLIALNFSSQPRNLQLPGKAKLLISTALDRATEVIERQSILRGNEGVILEFGE